jgi:hypothetical protein
VQQQEGIRLGFVGDLRGFSLRPLRLNLFAGILETAKTLNRRERRELPQRSSRKLN